MVQFLSFFFRLLLALKVSRSAVDVCEIDRKVKNHQDCKCLIPWLWPNSVTRQEWPWSGRSPKTQWPIKWTCRMSLGNLLEYQPPPQCSINQAVTVDWLKGRQFCKNDNLPWICQMATKCLWKHEGIFIIFIYFLVFTFVVHLKQFIEIFPFFIRYWYKLNVCNATKYGSVTLQDQLYITSFFHSLVCLTELMQTEMHHIRTLRIMSEVYSKGLQKEVQLELQTVDKLFPALDELLEFHTQHLLRLLERKKESQQAGGSLEGGFIINRIGDILVSQVSEQSFRSSSCQTRW